MAEGVQAQAKIAPGLGRADRGDSVRLALLLVTGALMLANLALIFFWVPLEQSMGILFLIFYFHVPLALAGFLAVGIVFISSILYLWKGQRKWDALAHSAAEIGVLFITLTIITGAIWAKKFNGVWWTWDPRLTTTLILWLMYVGYLMVRAYAPTPSQAARYSAVMGIISFIDVPIVYLSAVWWRNIIHPNLYLGPLAEEGSLDSRMEAAVMFSLLTFTFLLAYLVWERLASATLKTHSGKCVTRKEHTSMWLLRRLSPNRLLAGTGAALVWLMLTGNVLAVEHGQTNSAFDESPLPFLFAVYTITWSAFFAYAFYVNRRQRELRREIEELRKALEERRTDRSSS